MSTSFASAAEFKEILAHLPGPDSEVYAQAQARNAQLTKPPGALGRLEDLALWYCSWRGDPRAQIEHPTVIVFVGNHGVTAQGVSAFPADVTAQMVANFKAGGAAINQLSACAGATLTVHPLELERPTADISQAPAMQAGEFIAALATGWQSVDPQSDCLVVGEMGIGNTTPAAAMALALLGGQAEAWTGAGTGVTGPALEHKSSVVARAVQANDGCQSDGLEVLRCLGGREISAMAGAIARAKSERIPVILDGFICTAAALALHAVEATALDHTIAGHLSDEAAHPAMLRHLCKEPLLSLGLRLGEGSGAALAIGILKAALACHSGMATFAEAGVSDT